jgi:photosystem II stability/assembly factor-like uncharacterized protein
MAATSWVPENQLPHQGVLHGVFAIDGCHVWAVGEEIAGRSQIINTANGGATWNTVLPPPNSGLGTTLNRVAFADANTGYIVGENDDAGDATLPGPNILKTIDGGVTWTDLRPNLPANDTKQNQWWSSDFEGLAVVGNDVWVAWTGNDGQKGEILHSSDGGGSWDIKLPVSGSNVGMAGVSFADANHGWAIRDNGQVYQTMNGGANWNPLDTSDLQSWLSWNEATLEQVAAIDATHVVVVADDGTAWYLDGIGANRDFDQATVPSNNGFSDVSSSAGVVYAVGEGSPSAYKSTDGGQNFDGESLNNNGFANAVSIAAGTTFAWVVGETGHISANTAPATACPPAAAVVTVPVVPVVPPTLPSAGHPLMPADYNWILLLLIPAIGMLGWLSVKSD